MYSIKVLFISILFLFFGQNVLSQNILSPSEFLPHELGDQFTPHNLLVDYYKHVAENSSQVKLIEYGRTYESRPLLLAVVSSADNLKRLEELRLDNLRRAGILPGVPSGNSTSIIWLNFSVHGNEACGSEAAMPVLYELVTSAQAGKWLENTIVIIDPAVNPDGYARYTNWNRQVANRLLNPDINSVEHQEPWPGGRTNHYLFDLNRDWAWQSQVESRYRIIHYKQWLPHIVADFHEMGYQDPYYFAPAAQPYHELITPWQREFQETIGKNHAKYFSANGWLFYTKERFDLFYPSYGDTYPTYQGAIGMTYEQGGSGTASRGILLPTGDTLLLHDRIAHHLTTALSTIEMGSRFAEKIVSEFSRYYKITQTLKFNGFLIKNHQPAKTKLLCELLDLNHIIYGTLTQSGIVNGLSYSHHQTTKVQHLAGDLYIPVDQPFGVLTHILFEPQSMLEDSLTYDITAWALPYAFGLEAYALTDKIPYTPGFSWGQTSHLPDKIHYAYTIPWSSTTSAKALAYLLKNQVNVRYATESFSSDQQDFQPGTLLVLRGDNRKLGEDLTKIMQDLGQISPLPVKVLSNGFSSRGPDFGSDRFELIKPQRVLVLGREGVSSNAFGQVWYFFEQVLDYPLTIIKPDDLKRVDLNPYHLLIMTEGSYTLDKSTLDKIRTWISSGGKIVAIGSGINNLKADENLMPKTITGEAKKDSVPITYIDRFRDEISQDNPGTIFKVTLDTTHPLSFGLSNPYYTLKTNTIAFEKLPDGWNVGWLDKDLFYTGFIGSALKPRLKNSLVFGKRNIGRGSIVYLVDNPLFRAFWEEGNLLFANALFF